MIALRCQRTRQILRALACLLVWVATAVAAQTEGVDVWQVGVGGDFDWEAVGQFQGLSTVNGVLKPTEVDPADNALSDIKKRNGIIWSPQSSREDLTTLLTDGSFGTLWYIFLERPGTSMVIDLGTILPIWRIRFVGEDENFMRAYRLFVHDGDPDLLRLDEPIAYTDRVGYSPDQDSSVIDVTVPLQFVRFIKLQSDSPEPFAIAEAEVFGDGFAPTGHFISDVIDMGAPAIFGEIRVSVDLDPLTKVALQTRSGSVPESRTFYRWIEDVERGGLIQVPVEPVGFPEAAAAYEQLQPREKGGIKPNLEDWSPWTSRYGELAGEFLSPGNRQYLQFQLSFTSHHVEQAAAVESFGLEFAIPTLAREVIGEIVPAAAVMGDEQTFDYYIRSEFDAAGAGNTGFDLIRIATPFGDALETVELSGEPVSFEDIDDGDPNTVVVRLTEDRVETPDQVLMISFRERVTMFGTTFSGKVFDTKRGSGILGQEIVPGDATGISGENRLSIRGDLGGALVRDLRLEPAVFSPNGDGINDELAITYVLLKAVSAVPIELTVYDLAGRPVRHIEDRHHHGFWPMSWDGRDDGERQVPPGIYAVRLSVSTDTDSEAHTRLVGVVY